MSSLNALKYKITVKRSYYAGIVIFLLYLFVILLSLPVVSIYPLSLFCYLLLFVIALYAAKNAHSQQAELLLSESGLIERIIGEKIYSGKIGQYSIYNGFFILLQLDIKSSVFTQEVTKQFIIIYKDAISEGQYRLLARLINSGRS